MNKTGMTLVFCMWLATGVVVADDAAPIYIPTEVKFDEKAAVRIAVRNECGLEIKLANWIKTYADRVHVPVKMALGETPPCGSRILDVRITQVMGAGGGAWSGSKSVQVVGELREGDKVISTFGGSRVSGGGAFSGFKGTCSILGRCVKALGKDIAYWLKDPVAGARLGDG